MLYTRVTKIKLGIGILLNLIHEKQNRFRYQWNLSHLTAHLYIVKLVRFCNISSTFTFPLMFFHSNSIFGLALHGTFKDKKIKMIRVVVCISA